MPRSCLINVLHIAAQHLAARILCCSLSLLQADRQGGKESIAKLIFALQPNSFMHSGGPNFIPGGQARLGGDGAQEYSSPWLQDNVYHSTSSIIFIYTILLSKPVFDLGSCWHAATRSLTRLTFGCYVHPHLSCKCKHYTYLGCDWYRFCVLQGTVQAAAGPDPQLGDDDDEDEDEHCYLIDCHEYFIVQGVDIFVYQPRSRDWIRGRPVMLTEMSVILIWPGDCHVTPQCPSM